MKVYVLEVGVYSDRGIRGVYSTPEKAMAAWSPVPRVVDARYSYTWGTESHVDDEWQFDASDDYAASVFGFEIDG